MRWFDWQLVVWTFLSWMFSGGILYLVYQFGSRTATEAGLKVTSWRTVALLLGFVVCLAMYGTDYPDKGLIIEFSEEDKSTFLGIFLIIAASYVLGYVDTKRQAAPKVSDRAPAHPPVSS